MKNSLFPLGSSLIDNIVFFATIDIKSNHYTRCTSAPGHLVHLILKGNYQLSISGKRYTAQQGDILYYYETEEVIWEKNLVPVSFYSLAFFSSQLMPLPSNYRVFKSNRKMRTAFENMNTIFHQEQKKSSAIAFYGQTSNLISEIIDFTQPKVSQDKEINVWLQLEPLIRKKKYFKCDLNFLCDITHVSQATLARACHAAFKIPPMQRIREIRMENAKGLLLYTHMSISEISYEMGYSRVHEFSREFRKYFSSSPSEFKKQHL
ncbi:MAG: hypothetical protein COA79_17700 [Planctomycetota bacterium]|nr:MAG: hypothetical protein COA79_17700 [Planctomycetota bacterium]